MAEGCLSKGKFRKGNEKLMKRRKADWLQKSVLMVLSFLLVFSNFFTIGAPLTVSAAETGDTVYVSSDGDDNNDGTEDSPYKSIGTAFWRVANNEGTVVLLDDITLTGTQLLNTNNKVTIKSKDGEKYSIKRDENFKNLMFRADNGANVTFKNVVIDGNDVEVAGSDVTAGAQGAIGEALNAPLRPTVILARHANTKVTLEDVEVTNHKINVARLFFTMNPSVFEINEGTEVSENTLLGSNVEYPTAIMDAGQGGRIEFTGGEVSENTVVEGSNGVIVAIGIRNNPSFHMVGGKITNNHLNGVSNDTGNIAVFMRGNTAESRYEFGGTAYVYDNKNAAGDQRNVFLANTTWQNAYLSLVSKLEDGAKIGVYAKEMPHSLLAEKTLVARTLQGTAGNPGPIYGTEHYTPTAGDAAYFESDKASSAEIQFDGDENQVILAPTAPKIDNVWLNQTTVDGKEITLKFNGGVTFANQLEGLAVKVGGNPVTPESITINQNDSSKVIVTLPDQPTEDIELTYTESAGNLKGVESDKPVEDFHFTYPISFTTELEVTQPGDDPVALKRPEIAGKVTAGLTVDVVIKDNDGNVVDGAGGEATVDNDGNWTFTPEVDLSVGEYIAEVTATSEDGKMTVTKGKNFETEKEPITHPTGNAIETSEGQKSYTEQATPIKVDENITLDTDILNDYTDSLNGVTIMIENLQNGDALQFEDTEKIKGTYNRTTGVLTLTAVDGQEPTIEDYQTALQSVEFTTTSKSQVDREITFGLGTAFAFDENGHFYDFINKGSSLTWHAAKAEAETKSYFGRQGYLATITSAEENGFIADKTSAKGWIGAADIERIDYTNATIDKGKDNGDWRWVTGPEGLEDEGKGTAFFKGYVGSEAFGPVGDAYDNWQIESGARKEPNDYSGGEWVAHIFPEGDWNDYPPNNNSVTGYVIEYGGMPGDAEFVIKDTKTIEMNYDKPALESAEIVQTVADGNKITLTFDEEVEFNGDANEGFTVTIGDEEITLDKDAFTVDPGDATKVIITLPENTDLVGEDVTVSYDEEEGNLQSATTGAPVDNFEEKAINPFAEGFTITEPSKDPVITATPEIAGKVEPGAEVSVVIKDEDGNEVDVDGEVTVDEDGNWTFTPETDLADGDYTIEATATKDGKTATKTKDMMIDTALPKLDVIAPEGDVFVSKPTFKGTATPGSEVTVKISDDVTLTTTADEDGNWSVTPEEDLADGNYEVEITAEKDGKTSEPVMKEISIDTIPATEDVDKSILKGLKKDIDNKKLQADDYTADSFGDLQDALTNADNVLRNPDATQAEVDDAINTLTNAYKNLRPVPTPVDKTLLGKQKNFIDDKDLDDADYTEETWNTLVGALEEAEDVLTDDDATQAEVDEALENLVGAYAGLEEVESTDAVDKSLLVKLSDDIDKEGLAENDYTTDSWNALTSAQDEATKVLADDDASQEDVEEALNKLAKAYTGLQLKTPVDKTLLRTLHDGIVNEDPSEDDYTPNSWGKFSTEFSGAMDILDDLDATQDEVDEALVTLAKAYTGLVKKADKTSLQGLVDEVEDEEQSDYTSDSWGAFDTALSGAKDVLGNPNATQDEVDETLAELDKARKGLTKKQPSVDKSKLEKLDNDLTEGDLSSGDYTSASWKVFSDAWARAERILNDPDATQDEVDEALDALNSAYQGLALKGQVDKTKLDNKRVTIDDEELNADNYTEDSWKALQAAMTKAQKVLNDPNATQAEVDAALAELEKAYDGLKSITVAGDESEEEDAGEKLPKTATTIYNYVYAGLILLVLGAMLAMKFRRREDY